MSALGLTIIAFLYCYYLPMPRPTSVTSVLFGIPLPSIDTTIANTDTSTTMDATSPTTSRSRSVMSFISGRRTKRTPAATPVTSPSATTSTHSISHEIPLPTSPPLSQHQKPKDLLTLSPEQHPWLSPDHQPPPSPETPTPTNDQKDLSGGGFAAMVLRRRSQSSHHAHPSDSHHNPSSKYHTIRLVPHLSSTSRAPSLHFEPVTRLLKPNSKTGLTIGRYIDQGVRGLDAVFDLEASQMVSTGSASGNTSGGEGVGREKDKEKKSDKVVFKSKVVSRAHCQIVVDESGQVSFELPANDYE